MSLAHSPSIVMNGLVLALDAGNAKSYPGSGTAWYNLLNSSAVGNLVNGPAYSTSNGGTLLFDGINDYANIPISCNKTYYSLSWWLYPTSVVSYNQFISFDNMGTWGSWVFHTTSTGEVYIGTDVATRLTPTELVAGTVTLNTWQNFTYTFNNGVGTLYKNGLLLASKSGMTVAASNFTTLYLGTNSTNTINGYISNLGVYSNKVLSADEVMQNYNAIRRRYEPVTAPIIVTPQFVSSASSSTNNLGSMPSYQAGDLLLLVGMQTGSSTESTTPSGYTRINGVSSTGGVSAAGTLWYKIAGASETAPSISAGNICAMLVYRGVTGIGNSAVTAYTTTTSSFTYPTLTMTGPSFVAAFAVNPTYNFSTPASTTLVEQFEDVASPTTGSHAIAIVPTAGEVSSWSGITSTIGAGRIGVAMSVEITT